MQFYSKQRQLISKGLAVVGTLIPSKEQSRVYVASLYHISVLRESIGNPFISHSFPRFVDKEQSKKQRRFYRDRLMEREGLKLTAWKFNSSDILLPDFRLKLLCTSVKGMELKQANKIIYVQRPVGTGNLPYLLWQINKQLVKFRQITGCLERQEAGKEKMVRYSFKFQ